MYLEKLLRSIPIARRNIVFFLAVITMLFWNLGGLAYSIHDVVVYGYHPVLHVLMSLLMFNGAGLAFVLAIFLCLLPMLWRVKRALKKADYMLLCISNLSPDQQEIVESEARYNTTGTWRSEALLDARTATPPVFGEYCLYGKVATEKIFGVNQHVILPYQNIREVIAGPESRASKAERILNNALVVATVVSVFANICGGTYEVLKKRPTAIIFDDEGNAYEIDCEDVDWFLDNFFEKRMNQN